MCVCGVVCGVCVVWCVCGVVCVCVCDHETVIVTWQVPAGTYSKLVAVTITAIESDGVCKLD